jgi:hypothetical protein
VQPPSSPPASEPPFHPSLALAAYAEGLFGGGRVAVFGDATLGIAAELQKRGARLVHVYDSDAARAAEASAQNRNRAIYYAPLAETGDLGVRDGAFDCAIVADLSLATDAPALLGLVRRVVSPSGAAIIASPNAEAAPHLVGVPSGAAPLGYYDLYEAISVHFQSVRMIGQAPFVGYAIAEFSADGDPEPTIDSSLVRSEGTEPDWFVAIASERWTRVDPFCLVEIPARPVPADEHDAPTLPPPARAPSEDLAAAHAALRDQEQLLAQERKHVEQANALVASAREELSLVRTRAENLARALEREEQRRAAVETELEAVRADPEIARLRDRVRTLESSIEQAAEPHEAEVARIEQLLSERGAEILDLRREVDRRERLVREILSEAAVPPLVAAEPPAVFEGDLADLRARLDRLAAEVARREADLVAASWKIAMYEGPRLHPGENER